MRTQDSDIMAVAGEVLDQGAMTRSGDQLRELIRECERGMRRLLAAQLQCAEAHRQGLPLQDGARNTKAWLQRLLRISGPDATARITVARDVEQQHSMTGAPLPPQRPATAAALHEGEIGLEHAHALVQGMRRIAPLLSRQQAEQAETTLAGQARVLDPREVRVLAERARYHCDQDGALKQEQRQFQDRELHYAIAPDGMTVVKGRLDREAGAKLRAALEPLAAPQPGNDSENDPRTAGQRNADAMTALLDLALATDRLPRAGGQRPHITVTVDYDSLKRQLPRDQPAPATLHTTGQPVSAAQVRRWACDAEILPMVLGGDSQPLDIGRTQRSAPPHLRAALLARDGHCAFAGCDHPPGTSQAHHAISWLDGGDTALHNLVMLCTPHHRMIHTQGWDIDLTSGRPMFIPPSNVDPYRRPRPGGRPPPRQPLLPLPTAA